MIFLGPAFEEMELIPTQLAIPHPMRFILLMVLPAPLDTCQLACHTEQLPG